MESLLNCNMMIDPNNTDQQRLDFLKALNKSDIVLDERERCFVAQGAGQGRLLWFTAGRRGWTDAIMRKYKLALENPNPATSSSSLPDADPAGCEFLVRDEERRLGRCNQPAVKQTRSGFRYCSDHSDQVERDLKRRGSSVQLYPFKETK